MITLGIHDGHTATACIVKDGKIIAVVSEERLNRVKEWGGFPELAIKKCMEIAGIKPDDINGVGIAGLMKPTLPQSYPAWRKSSGKTPPMRNFSISTKRSTWRKNGVTKPLGLDF